MNTRWIVADCLFKLQDLPLLYEFLDDWLEECYTTIDLAENLVFAMKVPDYDQKKEKPKKTSQ